MDYDAAAELVYKAYEQGKDTFELDDLKDWCWNYMPSDQEVAKICSCEITEIVSLIYQTCDNKIELEKWEQSNG